MSEEHPKYLKKADAPNWDFHVWTPYLAERGDMLPFDPETAEPEPEYTLEKYGPGWYRIVDQAGDIIETQIRGKEEAAAYFKEFLQRQKEMKNDTAGAIEAGSEAVA